MTAAFCPECRGQVTAAVSGKLAACPACERIFRMPTDPEAKLSTGKVVLLLGWGWQQPDEQRQRYGPVSEAEAREAWALVDAQQKKEEGR